MYMCAFEITHMGIVITPPLPSTPTNYMINICPNGTFISHAFLINIIRRTRMNLINENQVEILLAVSYHTTSLFGHLNRLFYRICIFGIKYRVIIPFSTDKEYQKPFLI